MSDKTGHERTETRQTGSVQQATDRQRQRTTELTPGMGTDEVVSYLRTRPGRLLLMGIALIGVLLPWLSVSALGMSQSVMGIDLLPGKLYALVAVAVMVAEFKLGDEQLATAWMAGGLGLAVIGGLSWIWIQMRFSAARSELAGNPFAGALDMSIGFGLYIAIAAGVVAAYMGYRMMSEQARMHDHLPSF